MEGICYALANGEHGMQGPSTSCPRTGDRRQAFSVQGLAEPLRGSVRLLYCLSYQLLTILPRPWSCKDTGHMQHSHMSCRFPG